MASTPVILEVTTEHPVPFKTVMEALSSALNQVNFEFINDKLKNTDSDKEEKDDNSGLRIVAVDPTKTLLISLKMDAKNFASYKCERAKISLGVNINSFYRVIKSMDKDDNLTLMYDLSNKDCIRIKTENPDKDKKDDLELKLLDLGLDKNNIPKKYFHAMITMDSGEFHKKCREMNSFATHVEIKCYGNKIVFTFKGDTVKGKSEYTSGNGKKGVKIKWDPKAIEEGKPQIVQGIYELKNLISFGKCQNLCSDVEILMRNDFPLCIRYTVATLGKINLFVAPINE